MLILLPLRVAQYMGNYECNVFLEIMALTNRFWPFEYHGMQNNEDVVSMIICDYMYCQALLAGQNLLRVRDIPHLLF